MSSKILVAIVALSCTWIGAKADATTLDLAGLRKLATDLRAGDYQLVRVSPSDETAEQQKVVCPNAIPSLVATLTDSSGSLETRAKAAEVLALCTTNNPDNRNAIGTTGKNVHSATVQLIHDGTEALTKNRPKDEHEKETEEAKIASTAIGNAAEAIWILSFSSAVNHAGFLQAGAVSALVKAILNPHCENRNVCSRAIMWCYAALQNLSASYCSTDTGHCWWEWTEEDAGEEEEILRISSESPIVVDSQKVREEILNYPDKALLLYTLGWACHGPVQHPHHSELDENYAWPSLGEVTSQMEGDVAAPSVVPWAAVGLIKNLALAGPDAREKLLDFENMEECLCEMTRSPDWLESGKAETALYFLGVEDCPEPYDENCEDYDGWVLEEESEEDCEAFEENRWCVEFGHLQNADGITAKQACCACGGGTAYEEEL